MRSATSAPSYPSRASAENGTRTAARASRRSARFERMRRQAVPPAISSTIGESVSTSELTALAPIASPVSRRTCTTTIVSPRGERTSRTSTSRGPAPRRQRPGGASSAAAAARRPSAGRTLECVTYSCASFPNEPVSQPSSEDDGCPPERLEVARAGEYHRQPEAVDEPLDVRGRRVDAALAVGAENRQRDARRTRPERNRLGDVEPGTDAAARDHVEPEAAQPEQ